MNHDQNLLTDPRVENIAAFEKVSPATVIGQAEDAAAAEGDTVDEELTMADDVVGLISVLGTTPGDQTDGGDEVGTDEGADDDPEVDELIAQVDAKYAQAQAIATIDEL